MFTCQVRSVSTLLNNKELFLVYFERSRCFATPRDVLCLPLAVNTVFLAVHVTDQSCMSSFPRMPPRYFISLQHKLWLWKLPRVVKLTRVPTMVQSCLDIGRASRPFRSVRLLEVYCGDKVDGVLLLYVFYLRCACDTNGQKWLVLGPSIARNQSCLEVSYVCQRRSCAALRCRRAATWLFPFGRTHIRDLHAHTQSCDSRENLWRMHRTVGPRKSCVCFLVCFVLFDACVSGGARIELQCFLWCKLKLGTPWLRPWTVRTKLFLCLSSHVDAGLRFSI